jgi:uncharacterized protein
VDLRKCLILPLLVSLVACSTHAPKPSVNTAGHAQQSYEEVVRSSFYVPVRDGTRLAVNLYRPAVNGRAVETPLPVIFVFTPYRARFRNEAGEIVEIGLSERLGLKGITDHGYVVATADIRGKGASFGFRRGFQNRTEAQDGHDLVEWLARQPWSSGNVGMTGCSYLGGTTMQTASTAPPHLKAVFAGATDWDKYGFVRRGGITAQFNTRPDEPLEHDLASIPVDEDADGSLLRAAVAEHARNHPMAELWYSMPFRDSISPLTGTRFWKEVGPYTYADALRNSGIAFYLWSTWRDEPTEQILRGAANLPARVLIGPGTHCEPPPGMDFAGELRRFFDHHLKGINNGLAEEPRYTWWTLDAPEGREWTRSDSLPGSELERQTFHFAPGPAGSIRSVNDGRLGEAPPQQATETFQVDYEVGGRDYFPFWPAVLDEKGLTYTSPPLAENVVMTGFPVVSLRVASDQPDANLFVYLEEVLPDGTADNISFGRLALSHRKETVPPYQNLGLPWHSGRQADVEPAILGQRYELDFALTPSSKVFRAGSRLRVSIRGADPRQRNLEAIRRIPPERVTVWLGPGQSRIHVPFASPVRFRSSTL